MEIRPFFHKRYCIVACLLLLAVFLVAAAPARATNPDCAAAAPGTLPQNCAQGKLYSDPDCVKSDANHITCVARGYDDAVWIKTYQGAAHIPYWTDFTSIGGTITSAPSIAALSASSIDVVARGLNNGLWHNHFNGSTWSGFLSVPDTLENVYPGPDCIAYGTGSLCAVRWWTKEGDVVRLFYYNGSTWTVFATSLGQPAVGTTGGPTITSWGANRIDVVVRGLDNAFWQITLDDHGLSSWASLGGTFTSDPECISYTANYLECFGRGLNGHIWYKYWDGVQWNGWSDMGGSFLSDGGAGATFWGGKRNVFIANAATKTLWMRETALTGWYGWQDLRDPKGCTFVPFVKR